MVQILAPLFGAVLLFSGVMAAPMPDSAINEPAVSSPNGTPITEGAAPTPVANAEKMMMDSSSSMMMMESSSKMMMESSSKMMAEATSTKMMAATSTMMSEATSSSMMKEKPTSTKMAEATSSAMYGSGSSNYGSGYDSCVQQCMNSYGAPPAKYTPPPTKSSDSGSSGGGATHTVIVAPTKGVLRFIPFALNATVGDTIHYVWGAGPHTVTKGSQLEPCNKSSDASTFTSGPQNASFTFDEKVVDTNPIFFFCNVPGHCAKGMFGIVNPPNGNPVSAPAGVASTVGQMMPQWVANNSDIATMLMYTNNKTMGTSAYTWGNNINVADMPQWSYTDIAKNVMYTRLMFAANPTMLENGKGASLANDQPITIPADIDQLSSSAALTPAANAGDAAASASGSAAPSVDPTASGSAAGASSTSAKSGAVSTASSSAFIVGLIAVIATFMAL